MLLERGALASFVGFVLETDLSYHANRTKALAKLVLAAQRQGGETVELPTRDYLFMKGFLSAKAWNDNVSEAKLRFDVLISELIDRGEVLPLIGPVAGETGGGRGEPSHLEASRRETQQDPMPFSSPGGTL